MGQTARKRTSSPSRWLWSRYATDDLVAARRTLTNCRLALVQVFTSAVPFSDYSSVTAVVTIIQGGRPARPTYPTFTENLWKLMQRCWSHDPRLRPEVSEVLRVLLTP